MTTFHVSIEYEGDRKTFIKNLNAEEEITDEEIRKSIVDDFYRTFNIVITKENGEEI